MTTEGFIKRADIVHNFRYLYTKTIYNNSKEKLIVTCEDHGDFNVRANNHLSGVGCSICARYQQGPARSNTLEFTKKSISIHGNKYNYSKVKYINNHTKVEIICLKHKISFDITPFNHLSGKGCWKCADKSRNKPLETRFNSFLEKATKVHKGVYKYFNVQYIDTHTKVNIYCTKCNESFLQTPASHLQGCGCPKCNKPASTGFSGVRTYLYSVSINNGQAYKVGITRFNILDRFYKDLKQGVDIEILDFLEFEDGVEAFQVEQSIIKANSKYKYFGENILETGNTELFTRKIDIRKGSYDEPKHI